MRDVRWSKVGASAVIALGLAGCAGSSGRDPAETVANLFAFNTVNPPPVVDERRLVEVDCPIVQVSEGKSSFRSYAGSADAEHVRYQFSLGDLARECTADAQRIDIRVGVSGYVIAGPAGASGAFTVPVRVSIRSEKDQRIVASKSYRIAATLAPGEGQTQFSTVTEPLVVPYTGPSADEEYSIFVGLEEGGADKTARVARVARRRR